MESPTANDGAAARQLAETILRQGEAQLDAQVRLMLAADRRVLTLAVAFLTLTAMTAAAAITLIFPAAAWAAGVGLTASAATFGWAAWACTTAATGPNLISLPGNDPQSWWEDEPDTRPLAECLRRESANCQQSLQKNRERMRAQAGAVREAARWACLAPAVGFAAAAVTATVLTAIGAE